MASTRIPCTIEDLREMKDATWTEIDPQFPSLRRWVDYDGRLNKAGDRRCKRIWKAAEITGYNFTVRRYDFGSFADCICNECGHKLSFNNQTASWARKHRAKHLGVSPYSIWKSGGDLLKTS